MRTFPVKELSVTTTLRETNISVGQGALSAALLWPRLGAVSFVQGYAVAQLPFWMSKNDRPSERQGQA